MNLNGFGKKIAYISDNKKMAKTIISVDDEVEGMPCMQIEKGKFKYYLDPAKERDTYFVCGMAGSGKSYFCMEIIKQYIKTFPDNKIYLFSESLTDPILEDIPEIKRIPIEGIADNPIDWDAFKSCMCVFDDVDALTGKDAKTIYALRDKLLKNSRKFGVSVITTNHNATDIKLKSVLNESNVIVCFLANYNRSLKYLLENYLGINKNGVAKLLDCKGRATVFVKSYPNVVICEKQICTTKYLNNC
jgi:hypothetical protein